MEEGTGTIENFSFDEPMKFDGIKTKSNVRGKLEIMKIDEGVNAKFEDVEVKVEFECEKCLKGFTEKISVEAEERQFLSEAPEKTEDPNDLFIIDMKHYQIDLTEPLRQEIILHFPSIRVCSSGCLGICQVCGKDRNKTKCECKEQPSNANKPLAKLKSLIKN